MCRLCVLRTGFKRVSRPLRGIEFSTEFVTCHLPVADATTAVANAEQHTVNYIRHDNKFPNLTPSLNCEHGRAAAVDADVALRPHVHNN